MHIIMKITLLRVIWYQVYGHYLLSTNQDCLRNIEEKFVATSN